MKVSNGDIWQAVPALAELCKEPWPVKTAYWLAKLSRKLGGHHRDIDQVRVQLIVRYGQVDERGQTTVVKDGPSWPEFERSFNELMVEDVEIDVQSVKLPANEGFPLKPAILIPLLPFVEVDGDA